MLTTLTPIVYQGAVAPEAITMTVKAGESALDLTTVESVEMLVRAPDGVEYTWAASIVESTSSELVAQHLFAAQDTIRLGLHRMVLVMTVPGGQVRAAPMPFEIVDQYGVKKLAAGA